MQVSRDRALSSPIYRISGMLLLLVGILFYLPGAVLAQDGGGVTITAPDASQFPTVTFIMETAGENGFLDGLQPGDVKIIENSRELAPTQLTVQQPGVQVIVAFNAAPILSTQQGGSSLYQKLQASLQAWVKAQPAKTPDTFTLVGNEGLLAIRQTDPARWAEALAAYQPDLAVVRPGVSSLSQAVDAATDPNGRPNMKRALLYITPLPADNNLSALPNLTRRASQMGLRVFVWALAPSTSAAGKGLEALQSLADSTSGRLFLYTGAEELPDLEDYIEPLRSLYQVTYQSAVIKSGLQQLTVKVTEGGKTLTAPAQEFKLEVQPPNPMFLDPPATIQRKLVRSAEGAASGQPESVALRILIEFPDGHARPVKRSLLYVDGKVAAENTSAPFDRFTWNLAGYDTSQNHLIQVKVEDSLGLTRTSLEMPVAVQVEISGGAPRLQIPVNSRRLVVGGAVTLSALALVLVLWVSGRKGWLTTERRRRKRMLVDPVTQPVHIEQDRPRPNAPTGVDRASWPLPAAPVRKAPAWLLQLDEDNQPITGHTILFVRREMTFGRNPQQATCVLNFPYIDELHARLVLDHDGCYILTDAGSVAGTWVNYCPVPRGGARLEHGDLIHFGQAAFRFELAAPVRVRQPQVSLYVEP